MSLVPFVAAAMAQLAPGLELPVDLVDAIADVAAAAPLFPDDDSGIRTASLLVVTAWEESRFRADAVGDHGRSCGYFGLWVGRSSALCHHVQLDVEGATVRAHRMLGESLRVCRAQPHDERLGLYLGGACDRGVGISRRRWRRMRALLVVRVERAS